MKKMSGLVLLSLVSASAGAASCRDVQDDGARLACYDSVERCADVKGQTARLSCFDHGFDHWMATAQDEPAQDQPVRAAQPKARLTRAEKDDRAFPLKKLKPKKKPRETPRIDAHIVTVETDPYRIDYLTLDNGQVWREIQDSRVVFKAGQAVNIQAGIFGSHNLRVEGIHRLVKVRRVQ